MVQKEWIIGLLFVVAIVAVFACGCTTRGPEAETGPGDAAHQRERTIDWETVSLVDVSSGEQFQVRDFRGTPILIQTFTVLCPICTSQQQEVMKLRGQGGPLTYVALDIDPNEDVPTIRSHIAKNNFSGYYAVAPMEMTASLLNEFGQTVITPSSAPMVLVCPNGTATLLHTGIKSAEELYQLTAGC